MAFERRVWSRPNAYKQVVVTPVISGRITRVTADLGQHVQRGQTLAQIFSPELADAQTRYISARAELEAHEQELARTEKLVAIGAASRQELERIHAGHTARRADVESAASRLQLLGLSADAIEALVQGRIRAPRRTYLRRSRGWSPNAWRTSVSTWTRRRSSSPSSISRRSGWWQICTRRTLLASALAVQPRSRPMPIPDLVLQGRVSYIDPQVSPETRTAKVRIEVPNARNDLRLGMYAEALLGADGAPTPMIPRSAVQNVGDRTVVYLVNPKKARSSSNARSAWERRPATTSRSWRASKQAMWWSGKAVSLCAPSVNASGCEPATAPVDGAATSAQVGADREDCVGRAGLRACDGDVARRRACTHNVHSDERQDVRHRGRVSIAEHPAGAAAQPAGRHRVHPRKAGEIAFACGMNMLKGTVVVRAE